MSFEVVLLGMMTAAAGCRQTNSSDRFNATWSVDSVPMVSLGADDIPAGHEFNGVSSVLRLPDGAIVVANSGVPELALFDSTGKFERAVGRKGAGPGEFQGPITVFRWRGDSVLVYDPASLRWTLFDPALRMVRTMGAPNPDVLQPTWLYRGVIVRDGVLTPAPAWVTDQLDSARAGDPGYTRLIEARRDDLGALWIRDGQNDRRWTVFLGPSRVVGAVELPRGFEPLQLGADFVLGITRDSLGVETVHLHALQRDPSVGPAGDQAAAPQLRYDSTLLNAFPALMMAQEASYASHGRYTNHSDSLSLGSHLPFRLFMLGADGRHWAAVGVQIETGVTCGISVGWPAPAGWLDGTPFCGR